MSLQQRPRRNENPEHEEEYSQSSKESDENISLLN
jgi:hypothetical protein